jgi:membrane-bound lytic murein transglycosylase B
MAVARILIPLIAAGMLLVPGYAHAEKERSFDSWLAHFKQQARQQDISEHTLTVAFKGIEPSERVIRLDNRQPERKIGFDEYYKRTLTPDRVRKGQQLLRENWSLLSQIEQQYGVQAHFIVALWGIETSYGENTGGFDLIQALSTLSWDGRRGAYFEGELIKALKILQGNHVRRDDFKGSWAGAMGQIQFMPSSWFAYAVDYNGDKHKDIWTTRSDIFASAANYLSRNGWHAGERWGRQVTLGPEVDDRLINSDARIPLAEWVRLGVRDKSGKKLAGTSLRASLIRPDGAGGKTYLVYNNFQTIMSWNRSTYFALSVGMLADQIAQARPASQ